MTTSKNDQMELKKLQEALNEERESHRRTKIKLKLRENENHDITKSASYKLAKIIAKPKHYTYKTYSAIKSVNPIRLKKIFSNRQYVKSIYESKEFTAAFNSEPKSKTAVIIHLYYVDMLTFFKEKLTALNAIDYDLYITVTDKDKDKIYNIKKELPDANIAVVPNCGRDVLPFVQVMKQIIPKGHYTNILKMHSKKSPHRKDGDVWRNRIIDSLLPSNKKDIKLILETLDKKDSAIVGPAGEYVSMLVNFHSTIHHTKKIVRESTNEKKMERLMRQPDEYGFFGGTMFWAKIESIAPLINLVKISDFEPEFGQQDSTLAHALERLLNVIPELQGKHLYELHNGKVEVINYHTTNIPKWSDYAIDA